ncbi:hypothetical protein [Bordetella sp. 15P40C-2]|uniref:hypothetical protein n=1 Tax=Bordetella sp. 15P40C-2 TaxID=2572246 RepID=UPI0013209E8F|nr:hypothetical protein [Bordetella sp. 15P40C-2]MVW72065.1 hypothetical protein [Bordetella sp. 15P40C-2]
MAMSRLPFVTGDLHFLEITLTEERINAIGAGSIATVVTAVLAYGLIQLIHILLRRGVQKQLDPISLALFITLTVTLSDNVGRFLFSE